MNTEWVEDCIKHYYEWLKGKTYTRSDEQSGWVTVTTPFIGLFNDPIEIYMKQNGDTFALSDDGLTLRNLELVGAGINKSPKRKEWLDFILSNYGINQNIESDELWVKATKSDFVQKKHNLICAISEISDMEITAKHIVSSMFKDDVRELLDEQKIIYTPQFIIKGSTGIDFTFDFQLASRTKELVIKSFNSLNRMNVPNFLFSLGDIKDAREKMSGKELLSMAIINDVEKDIKPEFINALESKNTSLFFWSKRNLPESLEKLRITA